jgi:predicted HD phosphohydrolase
MKTVSFNQMKDGTKEDYDFLHEQEQPYHQGTARRLLKELASQGDETLTGYKVTRLEHALQSATRAHREGADIDWVVAALLHDIGDGLAPVNHDKFAAEILRPFVREECTWVVEHHGLFQTYYYGHFFGWDKNARDEHTAHPSYQACVDFCERWDQASFDPNYTAEPLSFFENMVEEVFARTPYDDAVIKAGVVTGLPMLEAAE